LILARERKDGEAESDNIMILLFAIAVPFRQPPASEYIDGLKWKTCPGTQRF
jgi:hypothetical protein